MTIVILWSFYQNILSFLFGLNKYDDICVMNNRQRQWFFLLSLSLIWGSSYILMKQALQYLSPVQVGALRMIFSAVFLLLFFARKLKLIQKSQWKYVLYNALLGTFLPVFMFTFAIQHIDSGIVAILNSFTPLATLILGSMFFGFVFTKKQSVGILIGMLGTIALVAGSASLNPNDNYWFALAVIIASIGYAFNVNILKKYLSNLDATAIAVGNFILVLFPAVIVLGYTGFFQQDITQKPVLSALGYIGILAIVGTGIAKIVFNRLVQISSPIFASSVTYIIPIVALFWGIMDGEKIYFMQILAGGLILLGVYMVNRSGN